MEADGSDGGAPVTNIGGGDFFSQELGTILRLRYSTESYGQDEHGNFDLGTMQVTNFDDATAFFDGQVTLNEQQGVGFNLGLGYRWLAETPLAFEPERVMGLSLWADGTNTKGGEFFPQIGVSYESLGDLWDMRVNGYIPLGARTKVGSFAPTGTIGFSESFIVDATVADRHTSFDAAELEIARRLGNERDAWLFASPYVLANEDDSSAGWKVGTRGYAYPDLMLQFAVSQDDIFHTNATFSLVWFVGRTRTSFQPACGLPDRMREPVLRNDYVALAKDRVHSGTPLTDPNGNKFNVVHVDSNAPAGGDGTFEHPLNDVADVADHSQAGTLNTTPTTLGSIVLLHANSVFSGATGASDTLVLKDNQRLLGEGNDKIFTVNSLQHGSNTIIPESSPGARAGSVPIILNGMGTSVVQLADTNEVTNFTIDGGANGIVASADAMRPGAGNPNIHDLTIQNNSGQGILLTPFVRDNDNDNTTPAKTFAFNVTLNNLTFNNVGGDEITINAAPPAGTTIPDPNVTLQEAMTINNITSTNGNARGIVISDTHSGGTATISNFNHDGGTTSAGALDFETYGATATVNTSTFTGGNGAAGTGVTIGSSTGSLTFADSVVFNGLPGSSVVMTGNTAGTVMFQGDITATPDINVNAIDIATNTGQDINFNGDLNLTAKGLGKAFTATGGGTLTATGTNNSLTSAADATLATTGTALEITGMTLSTAGATFKTVSAGNATTGPTNGIVLMTNTGGPITIGDTIATVGQTGTIRNTSGNAIVIDNSANVSITGLQITNTAAVSGVLVNKTTTGTQTVNLSDLATTAGDIGIEVTGGGATAGALNMTIADTNINSPTATGISFNDVDSGTIAANNTKVNGSGVTATAGVSIVGSNANFTFDNSSAVSGVTGTAFEVNGGTTGTITYNGSIANSAAGSRPVEVQNRTGGSVAFSPTSTITDSGGAGISIHNNTAGSVLVQGTNSLTPAANSNGVTLASNTGASITLTGLNIVATGTGRGLDASGGGTLEVDGTTNTISSVNGVGLSLVGMTISNAGANFETVTVTSGATNGIVLQTLTGGQVAIGNSAGVANSGGLLTTTGDAILMSNVQNVDLRHLHVVSAGGLGLNIDQTNAATTAMDVTIDDLNLTASTGTGVDVLANSTNAFTVRLLNGALSENVVMSGTGSGTFGLLVDSSDINTSTGTDIPFSLAFSGSAQNGNLVFRNGNNFTAGDASALLINSSGATVKTIDLFIDGTGTTNTFANASAGNATASFLSQGGTALNATIQGNTFTDPTAPAQDFSMTASGAAATILLNLGGTTTAEKNTALGGGGTFTLTNSTGINSNFTVVDRDEVFLNNRNNGTVTPLPAAINFGTTTTPPTPPTPP